MADAPSFKSSLTAQEIEDALVKSNDINFIKGTVLKTVGSGGNFSTLMEAMEFYSNCNFSSEGLLMLALLNGTHTIDISNVSFDGYDYYKFFITNPLMILGASEDKDNCIITVSDNDSDNYINIFYSFNSSLVLKDITFDASAIGSSHSDKIMPLMLRTASSVVELCTIKNCENMRILDRSFLKIDSSVISNVGVNRSLAIELSKVSSSNNSYSSSPSAFMLFMGSDLTSYGDSFSDISNYVFSFILNGSNAKAYSINNSYSNAPISNITPGEMTSGGALLTIEGGLNSLNSSYLLSADFGNSFPTTNPGVSGKVWNDGGTLKVSNG